MQCEEQEQEGEEEIVHEVDDVEPAEPVLAYLWMAGRLRPVETVEHADVRVVLEYVEPPEEIEHVAIEVVEQEEEEEEVDDGDVEPKDRLLAIIWWLGRLKPVVEQEEEEVDDGDVEPKDRLLAIIWWLGRLKPVQPF
jgi:hypothetical protein